MTSKNSRKEKKINFVFFGTPRRGADILETLKNEGFLPSLIVTSPDQKKGRGLMLTPPEVKIFALENNTPFIQPENLEQNALKEKLEKENADVFLVVSYGKIFPQWLLSIPRKRCLNLHFSLLPKYRGATPAEAAILNGDSVTGVTITLMDEKLDHGPIIAQEEIPMPDPLPSAQELVEILTKIGGKLLTRVLPQWCDGKIEAREQDHLKATFCGKIKKEDGLLDLNGDAIKNLRKIKAYAGWPGTYFFIEKAGKQMRVIVKDARISEGKLEILKVVPEGKKEMAYKDFLKGIKNILL